MTPGSLRQSLHKRPAESGKQTSQTSSSVTSGFFFDFEFALRVGFERFNTAALVSVALGLLDVAAAVSLASCVDRHSLPGRSCVAHRAEIMHAWNKLTGQRSCM
jgi:hypothetical protein